MFQTFKPIYLILILCSLKVFSQKITQPFAFRHINTTSGLSNNLVFDIIQDNDGYIWIATNNGLNKYNGYEFKVYFNSSDSTSISSNIVQKLLLDLNEDLWVATNNGLNLFDKNTETFKRFPLLNDDNSLIDIFNATLDKNNNIWFSYGDGIGKFNTETKTTLKLSGKTYKSKLLYDNNKLIWTSTVDGALNSIDIEKHHITEVIKDTSLVKSFIFRGDISENIWLPYTFSNTTLPEGFNRLPRLPKGKRPYRLVEIDEDRIFMGNYLGLFEYSPKANSFNEVMLKDSPSTLTNQIRCIYKDNTDGIWIGTANGIFYTDPYKKAFNHLNIKTKENDVVMAMHQGQSGTFVNILGDGLYHNDGEEQGFNLIGFPKWIPNGAKFIWDIAEIKESKYPIWLATGHGFYGYNSNSKRFKAINLEYLNSNKRESFSILNTKEDFAWVTSQYKIHKINKENLDVIASYPLPEKFSNDDEGIQKILKFDSKIVICTVDRGLYEFSPGTKKFQKIRFENHKAINEFKIPIWDLHVAENALWIGTNAGLYKLDTIEGIAEKVIQENFVIFSIADYDGVLWLGTEKGLIKYNIQDNSFISFNREDGLINSEFNRKSILKDSISNFWFGGVNGITFFNPSNIKLNTVQPKVEVTYMHIIAADTLISVDINSSKKVMLPYNNNNFVIDYVALNYTNPLENKYKYQLLNYNPTWIDEQNRKARFFQISPGKYNFKVIASNNDNVWNDVGDTLEIEILSPYWQTWWFYALIVLILLVILYSIYAYRVKKIVELERTKLRIAGDLHDEIGSGLSGIALTSDILSSTEIQDKDKTKLIKRITENSRSLASKLDDIVWLINPNKETISDYITKTTMVAKEFLAKEELLIKNTITPADERRVLNPDIKRHLLLYTKEVINNISKHASAHQVFISFTYHSSILEIIIRDDGKGFDLEMKTAGNGLLSLKNRAKEIKARLQINSIKDEGTTFSLRVKLP